MKIYWLIKILLLLRCFYSVLNNKVEAQIVDKFKEQKNPQKYKA